MQRGWFRGAKRKGVWVLGAWDTQGARDRGCRGRGFRAGQQIRRKGNLRDAA